MNKKEFVSAIAEKTHLTLGKAEEVLEATFATICEAMLAQDNIAIADFGSFTTRVRAERKGRNLQTGEDMVIPQAIVPVFKAHRSLKAALKTQAPKEDVI